MSAGEEPSRRKRKVDSPRPDIAMETMDRPSSPGSGVSGMSANSKIKLKIKVGKKYI